MRGSHDGLAASPSAVLQAALRWWTPARATGLQWAAWAAAALISVVTFAAAARHGLQAQELGRGMTPVTAVTSTQQSSPTTDDGVLARMPSGDVKPVALQTLDLALSATPSVQLVSSEFSALAGGADRLGRTDIVFRLRGPYADVKHALSIWSARFESGSVLSLRLQQQPSIPGVLEMSVSAALWSGPTEKPEAAPIVASPTR